MAEIADMLRSERADLVALLETLSRLPWNPADCQSDLVNSAAGCPFEPSEWVADSNRLVRRAVASTDARYVDASAASASRRLPIKGHTRAW